jgi:alpha-methylacyl-CoA racemase
MAGPLQSIRIIEFAGIGPAPFCAMMLADHGADIIRIERPGARVDPHDALARSRRSVVLDIKSKQGRDLAHALCDQADGLIEGFRPGVMERLGLGPDRLLATNPRLVYGRMTGWGQTGTLAQSAGHDINYIALSGVLHGIGRPGAPPVPPANYIGDFGGGGMMLAFGIVSALLAVRMGAPGQIIDAAMTDGSALLAAMPRSFYNAGLWQDAAGVNVLDGGAHFYQSFACADGKYLAVGAIEPQFYALLREKLGLADDPAFDAQFDRAAWPDLASRLAAVFCTRARDAWCALLEGTDACVTPVLSLQEAPSHPHNVARETFVTVNNATQPAPAPRFSATCAAPPRAAVAVGADTDAVLKELGYGEEGIGELRGLGVIE